MNGLGSKLIWRRDKGTFNFSAANLLFARDGGSMLRRELWPRKNSRYIFSGPVRANEVSRNLQLEKTMGLKFLCKTCGEDIVVRFLKVGEAAKCKNCGASNPVPASAESIDDKTATAYQSQKRPAAEVTHGPSLRPTRMKKASKGWITSLYVLAFIRAGIAVLVGIYELVLSEKIEIGTLSVGTWAFLDSAILTVLGVGALKCHIWAGYGLIVYSVLDSLAKVISGELPGGLGSLFWVVLFTVGTVHLFRLKESSNIQLDLPFVFRWASSLVIISFLSGFFMTFNPAFLKTLLGPPGSHSRTWIITVCAYALMLGSQTLAVTRKVHWTLEHVLLTAFVASVLGGLLDLAVGRSLSREVPTSGYFQFLYILFFLTFLAWAIAIRIKLRSPAFKVELG